MKDFALLIIPLIVFIVTIFGCETASGERFLDDIFSRNQSRSLQAFACIGVMIHHITQKISYYGLNEIGPITMFNYIGVIFTAIFFFVSGYGLIISVKTRPKYLKGFIPKKIIHVYLPFVIINIVFLIVNIKLLHCHFPKNKIIEYIFGKSLINTNTWYIIEILLLYLGFYILFKLIPKKSISLFLMCIYTLVIIYIAMHTGHTNEYEFDQWFYGEWWYDTTLFLMVGMLFAYFKDGIVRFCKRFYWQLIAIFIPLFGVALAYNWHFSRSLLYGDINGKYIVVLERFGLCFVTIFLIFLISMKVSLGNKLILFIADLSLEMYMIHALFINELLDLKRFPDWACYALVFLCSFALAAVYYFAKKLIEFLIRKIKLRFTKNDGNSKSDEIAENKTDESEKKDVLAEYEKNVQNEKRKKKLKKRILLSGLGMLILVGLGFLVYTRIIRPNIEYNAESRVLDDVKVGDEIKFGRYRTDKLIFTKRLTWIVAAIDDGNVMLVSKKGIAGSAYNQEHKRVVWENCDLHEYMNHEMYDAMFSDLEKEIIVKNQKTEDYLTLLTPEEAAEIFDTREKRQLEITDNARSEGTNVNIYSKVNYWDTKNYRSSWWWLRGEGWLQLTAPIVSADGDILLDEKYVNKPNGAVRPVVWVRR